MVCRSKSIFEEQKAPRIGANFSEDYFGTEKGSGAMRMILEQTVANLMAGKTLSLEEKATIIEEIHKPAGKAAFLEVLADNVLIPTKVSDGALKDFGELVNYLLTDFVLEKEHNQYPLTVVLQISRKIYAIVC